MKYIISIGIGGIIGYFTNWLAIRMLFRPYEKKFFLGLKLPFTPGLIPKEKDRISQSIGSTVENYLLSPETIVRFVDREKLGGSAKNFIGDGLSQLEASSLSLGDLALKFDLRLSRQEDFLKEFIGTRLLSSSNIDRLSKKFVATLEDSLESNREEIFNYLTVVLKDQLRSSRPEDIEGLILDFLDSYEDDLSLSELLGPEFSNNIKSFIDENQNLIAYRIGQFMEKKEIQDRIKKTIMDILRENVSGLLGSFLPLEAIANKGLVLINNYFKGPGSREDISNFLKIILDETLDIKLLDLKKKDLGQLSTSLSRIFKEISPKLSLNLVESLKASLDNLDLKDLLQPRVRSYLASNNFQEGLLAYVSNLIRDLAKLRLGQVISLLNIDSNRVYNFLVGGFREFVEPKLPQIIESLNIGAIVEKTIGDFDYEFTENLILDIAKKELKAITYLGGLLGGLIGLIYPLMELFLFK